MIKFYAVLITLTLTIVSFAWAYLWASWNDKRPFGNSPLMWGAMIAASVSFMCAMIVLLLHRMGWYPD